jgi:glucokinase
MTSPTAIGIDLGGTNIKASVIAGPSADVVTAEVYDTPSGSTTQVVSRLGEIAKELIALYGPLPLGLGVPGQFDRKTGVLRDLPNLEGDWDGYPLGTAVRDEIGQPVTLINDAQAFTLAEAIAGAGRGYETVAGIALGTGIGGGLVIAGRVHHGAHGSAGEVGHQVIAPDSSVECSCGNHGCLEALARADALADRAGQPDAASVFDAVRANDARAAAALAAVAEFLGIGLANLITLVDPDVIVVGGGLAQAGDLLLDPIREATSRHVRIAPPGGTPIVQGSLGINAGAAGAALRALTD